MTAIYTIVETVSFYDNSSIIGFYRSLKSATRAMAAFVTSRGYGSSATYEIVEENLQD